MQIVIDQSDFRRPSPEIQVALIEALGGDKIPKDAGKGSRKANSDPGLHWRCWMWREPTSGNSWSRSRMPGTCC